MFTYPIFGGGSKFQTDESLFIVDTTNNVKYFDIDSITPSVSLTDSIAEPVAAPSLATDGTFVFITTGAGGSLGQYAWSGSALTQRHSASTGSSNTIQYAMRVLTEDPSHLIHVGSEDFSHGLQAISFQTAPTYSYAETDQEEPANDAWDGLMDFRVADPEGIGYGDTFVTTGQAASQDAHVFTFASGVATDHSNLALTQAGFERYGWDRDTGEIAACTNGTGTTVRLYDLNMSTRALTSRGTGTSTANNYRCAYSNGFLVILETSGNLRSYSVSGTTLTLEDTLNIFTSTLGSEALVSSPFTDLLYAFHSSLDGKIISVANDGTLSTVTSISGARAVDHEACVFAGAALPTV